MKLAQTSAVYFNHFLAFAIRELRPLGTTESRFGEAGPTCTGTISTANLIACGDCVRS